MTASEVARRLGVARQVACHWKDAWQTGAVAALASNGQTDPKPKLDPIRTQQVVHALLEGPAAHS